jgi:hypothetical protein
VAVRAKEGFNCSSVGTSISSEVLTVARYSIRRRVSGP